jgi:ISXO2-like transposase domain
LVASVGGPALVMLRARRHLLEGVGGVVHDNERVRGDVYTNTAECRFSLMKRAVYGSHHSISEVHLDRYMAEWDFKWNTRKMKDGERAALIAHGIAGKRLTYRPTNESQNA